jgi:multidrug resistance efflux pump
MPAKRTTFLLAVATCAAAALAQSPPPTPAPVTAMASVEAFWSADQYARTSGYVAELKADLGDRVTKGQLLATLDAPELDRDVAAAQATVAAKKQSAAAAAAATRQAQAALDVARAQLEGVRAESELADANLKRQEQLFQTQAITDQARDEVRAKGAVARAAVQTATAKIQAAEADLAAAQADAAVAAAQVDVAAADLERATTLQSYTRIVAPFDGVVTRRLLNPGDLVQPGPTNRPLFTCQQLDPVRVSCDVPESAAANTHAGTPAEITLPSLPGHPLRAAVTRTSGSINPATRTMRVEIELPNPDGKLRPGSYAQVTLNPAPAAATTPTK